MCTLNVSMSYGFVKKLGSEVKLFFIHADIFSLGKGRGVQLHFSSVFDYFSDKPRVVMQRRYMHDIIQ